MAHSVMVRISGCIVEYWMLGILLQSNLGVGLFLMDWSKLGSNAAILSQKSVFLSKAAKAKEGLYFYQLYYR